ncbi:oligosaccharide flippase family protein [Kineococcus sp. T13]|uniref:oligosaccharide flippase family protein n=1 Tax=Kineococcus vitellinus TaxID=2696565 RepID=UPI0014124973|nr:oligosaccharide flippase family protein [Kineococcus vitellinus]NAZ74444.1 oligosaccharide flippase family protein [Kineococcus vitellinus]
MGLVAKVRGAGMTRGVWNVGDQLISSANNFLVQVVIAKSVSQGDFGTFAIVFSIFSVAVGFFRALSTAPVGMRFAASDDREFGRATASSVGLVLVGGLLLGAALVLAGLLAPFPQALSHSLVALGVVLPGLLMQDGWRQVLFARLRPAAACLLDGTWGALQLLAVVLLFTSGVSSVPAYVLAWGGAAIAASFVGLALVRVRPRPTLAVGWLREQSSVTRYLVPEYVLLQSGAQIAVLVVAAVAGTAAAGALRGANMLTVPATILSTGLMTFAVPELARRRDRTSPRQWMLAAWVVSGLVAVTGAVWGSLFLLLPDAVGQSILGDSWAGTREVLVPIIVGQAGAALSVGPAAVLYATEGAKVTIRLHAVYAVLLIGLSTVGAVLWGAVGTAWGMAAAFCLIAPWWFLAVRRHVRRTLTAPPTSSAPTPVA